MGRGSGTRANRKLHSKKGGDFSFILPLLSRTKLEAARPLVDFLTLKASSPFILSYN